MTHERDHGDGNHVHTFDWKAELEQMRDDARHFYVEHFDWRGHGPPPDFQGPRYYPPSEEWRLIAHLDRSTTEAGQRVTLATSTGQLREMEVAGDLVFNVDGAEQRLGAFVTRDEEDYEVLFVPFRDGTSGTETYGAGRYVEVPYDRDRDDIELDFNFAYNPSCVFSPAYDCPFPPPRNRLDVPIRAGERMPFEK
jgi:uncharacterized protein